MEEIPIVNENGSLLCPRCGTRLERSQAPFKLDGDFVCFAEAYICPICFYQALTRNGYRKVTEEASRLGLIGSPEKVERKIEVEEIHEPLNIQRNDKTIVEQFKANLSDQVYINAK
ncbi:MAG: hypothetical protein JRN26_01110 [Nitrososphaerota archaeon]|jgi:predicted RNA-binding Zn-ribbon protein involved in translation (DUF1610 family)|nr:hypothetical protein [Nitrososphaerota archaeon]MDG6932920.1 hypothetical protein [Nitrososphaerota archaeon]MDG6935478.1 hypothetical protein [Nitrososphaerota archaeon]MDG6943611.1 hypothetical protein [Nitrososphaerota archaeon]